jgi:peptidoglycan/LPS O-acetylase OafA/YrhL
MSRISQRIVRLLSRATRGEYIPEVDGIRFIAIAAVLIFHEVIDLNILRGTAQGWNENHGFLLHLIGLGFFGVEIFFALSGFVVALPFARHAILGAPAPDLGRYYLRRVTRIEPPYILALTATWVLSPNRWILLPDFLSGLIYSHQYIFGGINKLAPVMWSLEVEIAFYIFAPLLTVVYRIPGKYLRWLVQLLLIGSTSYNAVYLLPPALRAHAAILEMIPHFLAGMLLADWYASGLLRRSANLVWDLAVAAACWGLVYVVGASVNSIWTYYWLTPFLTMLLFSGILKGRIANWLLRLRPITLVGGMCYTLYLWHSLILYYTPYSIKAHVVYRPYMTGVFLCFVVVTPAVVAACIPIYLLTEKPFMNGPASRFIENRLRAIRQFLFGSGTASQSGELLAQHRGRQ